MVEQSRELATALDQAAKPHRYLELANGDHYLSLQHQRREVFEAMEQFLAEHLK